MCVIIASNTKKVPVATLDAAVAHNKDGNGLAWVENGKVRYCKSMELEPIKEIYDRIEPPYIFHARIASQGGVSLKLCHPFPMEANVPLEQDGVTDAVLFHNGNVSDWREMCKEAVLRHKLKWPNGPWSDSRAFAWLCFHFGTNFAELLDQKIAILNSKKVRIFGDGWTFEDEVYFSNKYFEPTVFSTGLRQSDWYQNKHWDNEKSEYVQNAFGESKCDAPGCDDGWVYNVHTQTQDWCPRCTKLD